MRWMRCEQKRLQRLSETVPFNNRILQAVRQGIPDRRTSHTESPSAIGAELVTRYDQELLSGGSKMLPWCDTCTTPDQTFPYCSVCAMQLLEDMLTMFDLMQLWQLDSNSVELEQIGLRLLLAFCANGVLDVSSFFLQINASCIAAYLW